MSLKHSLPKDKNPHIVHSQYYGSWCFDEARGQGISNPSLDRIFEEYSGFPTRIVKPFSVNGDLN